MRLRQVRDVCFLAGPPGRLRRFESIGAVGNDSRHDFAESRANIGQPPFAAGILGRVVQQGADGLVFVSAVFERERRHAQQMRDKGHVRRLASLPGMNRRGIDEGLLETRGENHARLASYQQRKYGQQIPLPR